MDKSETFKEGEEQGNISEEVTQRGLEIAEEEPSEGEVAPDAPVEVKDDGNEPALGGGSGDTGFETSNIDVVIEDVMKMRATAQTEMKEGRFPIIDPDTCDFDPNAVTTMIERFSKGEGVPCFENLIKTYPLLSRHVISTGNADEEVLKKYFSWVSANQWVTHEEFLGVQAQYFYFLAIDKGFSEKDAESSKQEALDELLGEDAKFKSLLDESSRKYEANENAAKKVMMDDLKGLAKDFTRLLEGEE